MLAFILALFFTLPASAQPILENGIHEAPCKYPIPEEIVVKQDFGRFCKYEALNAGTFGQPGHLGVGGVVATVAEYNCIFTACS